MAVTASMVKLGFLLAATDKMTAVIGAAVKQSTAKLTAFEKGVNKIGANFTKVGGLMTTAGVGIFEGMFKLASNTADYGNEIYKASQKIGMGFDEYQKLAYAAKQAGVEQSELASIMVSFNKTIVSAFSGGNKEVANGLKSLGVSIKDASGKMRKQEDILKDIADVFSKAEDSAGKMTIATKLFGKSGANLIPMLNGGTEGLAEMAAELAELGLLTEQQGEESVAFSGALTKLTTSFTGLKNEIGVALIPKITVLIEKAREISLTVRDWVKENAGLVYTITNAALRVSGFLVVTGLLTTSIGLAISVFGKFIVVVKGVKAALIIAKNSMILFRIQYGLLIAKQLALTTATKAATAAQWLWNGALKAVDFGKYIAQLALMKAKQLALTIATKVATAAQWLWNAAMYANPIGLIIAAVAALAASVYLIIKNWDKIKDFFVNLWNKVKQIFAPVWEWIKNLFLKYHPVGLVITHWDKIVEWFSSIWERVKAVFAALSPIEWLTEAFAKIKGWFANLKTAFFDFGKNIIQGLIDGVKAMFTKVFDTVSGLGNTIKEKFTGFLGIKSPSTVFAEYGLNITKGLTGGIEKGGFETARATESLAMQAMRGTGGTSNAVNTSSFGGVTVNYSPTVNVTKGSGSAQDILAALRQHKPEFLRWMDEAMHNRRRLAFAD